MSDIIFMVKWDLVLVFLAGLSQTDIWKLPRLVTNDISWTLLWSQLTSPPLHMHKNGYEPITLIPFGFPWWQPDAKWHEVTPKFMWGYSDKKCAV